MEGVRGILLVLFCFSRPSFCIFIFLLKFYFLFLLPLSSFFQFCFVLFCFFSNFFKYFPPLPAPLVPSSFQSHFLSLFFNLILYSIFFANFMLLSLLLYPLPFPCFLFSSLYPSQLFFLSSICIFLPISVFSLVIFIHFRIFLSVSVYFLVIFCISFFPSHRPVSATVKAVVERRKVVAVEAQLIPTARDHLRVSLCGRVQRDTYYKQTYYIKQLGGGREIIKAMLYHSPSLHSYLSHQRHYTHHIPVVSTAVSAHATWCTTHLT